MKSLDALSRKLAEAAPVVNYLADDRMHVTLSVLVAYLLDIRATLLDAQERAYNAGQEDWSDEFSEVLQLVMDIMPGEAARKKAAAREENNNNAPVLAAKGMEVQA